MTKGKESVGTGVQMAVFHCHCDSLSMTVEYFNLILLLNVMLGIYLWMNYAI